MLKLLLASVMLLGTFVFASEIFYDFNKASIKKWHTLGTWKIAKEDKEKILSLTDRSNTSFNLCYNQGIRFLDGDVAVKFKANSGHIDQGGGLIWRVQDNENYYVARFNPLEDNFRFYIVQDGIRSELASADVKLTNGWHTMRITHKGDTFEGYLDGKKYLECKDSHLYKTGGVGVWSKADALTSFSMLSIKTDTETK